MTDAINQAVAMASKPFLDGVSEMLGHDFTAEERLTLCGELEAFMVMTIFLMREIPAGDREGNEVVDEALGMTSPVLAKAVLDVAGDARDAADEELARHIHAFFTLAAMTMMALDRGKRLEEE